MALHNYIYTHKIHIHNTHTHLHTYTNTHTCIHTHIYIHIYIYIYIYTYTLIYTYTYIQTYNYIYTYVSGIVMSHARALPLDQGINMAPFGRLPFYMLSPVVSLCVGILKRLITLHMMPLIIEWR